jgi:hypothetical protein
MTTKFFVLLLISLLTFVLSTPTNCNDGGIARVLEFGEDDEVEMLSVPPPPCHDKTVCLQDCSALYPGCTKQTFAEVQTTSLVPAHYCI